MKLSKVMRIVGVLMIMPLILYGLFFVYLPVFGFIVLLALNLLSFGILNFDLGVMLKTLANLSTKYFNNTMMGISIWGIILVASSFFVKRYEKK